MTPNHSAHSVLQLHSPFPLTGLSRVGSAARAVREGLLANASNVIFTARQDDVHRLLRSGVRAVVLHDDASEYFALRAAAEVDGRAPPRRARRRRGGCRRRARPEHFFLLEVLFVNLP